MNKLESWLLSIFAGKVVARIGVTFAGALAAGPIHDGLAMLGITANIDQGVFATGTVAIAHALFEWYKKKRGVSSAIATSIAPPSTTKVLAWLFLPLFVLAASPAQAFDFGVPKNFQAVDSQMYFRSFAGGAITQGSTGVCYGPLFQLNNNGSWIADFLSICGWPSVSLKGDTSGKTSAIFGGQLFNWWGLQGGLGYNPLLDIPDPKQDKFSNRAYWGIGFSITGAVRQLSKAATPPPAP